jgi:hypothetical protein
MRTPFVLILGLGLFAATLRAQEECLPCQACLNGNQVLHLARLGPVNLDCQAGGGGPNSCHLPELGAPVEPASALHALAMRKLEAAWPRLSKLFLDPTRDFVDRASGRVLRANPEAAGAGAEWSRAAEVEVYRHVAGLLDSLRVVRLRRGDDERLTVLPIGGDPVLAYLVRQLVADPGFTAAELAPHEERGSQLATSPALDLAAQVERFVMAAQGMTREEFDEVQVPQRFGQLMALLRPGSGHEQ